MANVNPWWVTGLTDGEACFNASVRNYRKTYGKRNYPGVEVRFELTLRADDVAVLIKLLDFFKVGGVYQHTNGVVRPDGSHSKPARRFSVQGINDLYKVVVRHFDRYPLQSKKGLDYAIWRQLVVLKYENRYKHSYLNGPILSRMVKLVRRLSDTRRYQEVDF